MLSKKFKYQEQLNLFPNCPPESYEEMINKNSFRWVLKDNILGSFEPMNIIREPPQRILDDTDLTCKGYGLSLFDTFDHGRSRYKSLYKKKRGVSHDDFLKEKGDAIAKLQMSSSDGVHGDLNTTNGHFTFHEYKETDLSSKIVNITEIFNENGDFKQ